MGSRTRAGEWRVLPVCGVCGAARRDCGTEDMLWCPACSRGEGCGRGLAVCAQCALVDDSSYTGEARAYCPRCFNVPRSPLQHLHKCIKCFRCPVCDAPAFVHAAPVASAAGGSAGAGAGATPLCRIRAMCVRCQWTSAVSTTAATQQKAFIAFCQQALNAEHHAVLGDRNVAALVDLLRRCSPAEETADTTDGAAAASSEDGNSGEGNNGEGGAQGHPQEAAEHGNTNNSTAAAEKSARGVPLSVLLPRRRAQGPAPSLAELDRSLEERAEFLRTRNSAPIPAPAVKSPPQPFADGKLPYGLS